VVILVDYFVLTGALDLYELGIHDAGILERVALRVVPAHGIFAISIIMEYTCKVRLVCIGTFLDDLCNQGKISMNYSVMGDSIKEKQKEKEIRETNIYI